MKVFIRHSKLVKPEKETPQHTIWTSNIDLVIPRIHTPSAYFYRPARANVQDFFSFQAMESSLARALVPFYPMAGRLQKDACGRIEINCNGEGVLLVEATVNVCVSEFGDFAPTIDLQQLVPKVAYTEDISSYPLLVLQVTFFKCGGVSLGVGMQHHVADGLSGLHFINTWANMARVGVMEGQVYMDRSLLRARQPPIPKFAHVEYHPPPPLLPEENGIAIADNDGLSFKAFQNDFSSSSNGDSICCKASYCDKIDVRSTHMQSIGLIHCNGNPSACDNQSHYRLDANYEQEQFHNCLDNGNHAQAHYSLTEGQDSMGTQAPCSPITQSRIKSYGPVNGDDTVPCHAHQQGKGNTEESIYGVKNHCFRCSNDTHDANGSHGAKLDNNTNPDDSKHVHQHTIGQNGHRDTDLALPAILHLTKQQIMELRLQAADKNGGVTYSTYEAVSAHVWRCVSRARKLRAEQETKLYIATDGRARLKPSLPEGYFGNVIFTATPMATAGELCGEGLGCGAAKIRKALERMDDEYLRSALDYLEVQPDLGALVRGAHTFKTPNLGITSWTRLPIHDADFGWGRPTFMGPAGIPFEGLAYLLPSPSGDGSINVSLALSALHMPAFMDLFYQF